MRFRRWIAPEYHAPPARHGFLFSSDSLALSVSPNCPPGRTQLLAVAAILAEMVELVTQVVDKNDRRILSGHRAKQCSPTVMPRHTHAYGIVGWFVAGQVLQACEVQSALVDRNEGYIASCFMRHGRLEMPVQRFRRHRQSVLLLIQGLMIDRLMIAVSGRGGSGEKIKRVRAYMRFAHRHCRTYRRVERLRP